MEKKYKDVWFSYDNKNFVLKGVNLTFEKGKKAILDVDSDNMPAYNLYKKLGFKIDFQADYYEHYI